MSDLISRQAAVDGLKECRKIYCDNTPESFSLLGHSDKSRVDEIDNAIAILVNLPSAEPETIRCKDCKHRQEDECPMYHVEWVEYDDDGYIESDDVIYDYTEDDGYCHMAERRTDD